MAKYATGKRSQAISDRSGMAFPYTEMVKEWNGSLVHISEFEPKHPQIRRRHNTADAIALQNTRNMKFQQPSAKFSNDIGKYLSKRSLIFCLVKNNFESLFGYVACIENKVVTVLLDADLNFLNLKKLLKAYSPNYLWLEKQTCQKHFSEPS